jgi:hypothetical protein
MPAEASTAGDGVVGGVAGSDEVPEEGVVVVVSTGGSVGLRPGYDTG